MSVDSAPERVDYLTQQLIDFHTELVRVKLRLAAPLAADADLAERAAREPAQVAHALRGFLEGQSGESVGRGGRFVAENARDADYLKAALADEVLIGLQAWPGHALWIGHLLEFELFRTRCAGDRVFERIAALEDEHPAGRRAMANLYLLVLAMGFEGRHRGTRDGAMTLQALRVKLFQLAYERAPDPAFAGNAGAAGPDCGQRLLAQGYRPGGGLAAPLLLPNPRRWIAYFCLAALLLLALSQVFWREQTGVLNSYLLDDKPVHASGATK